MSSGTRNLLELAAVRAIPVIVVADSGKDLPDDEIDEMLAASPEVIEEGTGRRWPIFEAAPSISSRPGFVSRIGHALLSPSPTAMEILRPEPPSW